MLVETNESEMTDSHYLNSKIIEAREYQLSIAKKIILNNYLVVIPTGMGKTIIAVIDCAKTLEHYPDDAKIIMLAPTKPLVNQHAESFRKLFNPSKITIPETNCVITGSTPASKRKKIFEDPAQRILFYTPQTLNNDLLNKLYDLSKVCLIIFDEAHHATGDYDYVNIANIYAEQNRDGNILGLTASPGSSKEKINTICANLHIPPTNIEIRTEKDDDTAQYVHKVNIVKIPVEKTPIMNQVVMELNRVHDSKFDLLKMWGFIDIPKEKYGNTGMGALKGIESKIKQLRNINTNAANGISTIYQILLLRYMIKTVEAEGIVHFLDYITNGLDGSSKASLSLKTDPYLIKIKRMLTDVKLANPNLIIHPKLPELQNLLLKELTKKSDFKAIIFTMYRNVVLELTDVLSKTPNLRPVKFVGQAKRNDKDIGLSQKEQIQILDDFRKGTYNLLIATQVAEEGLDIAECDCVVFYDNVPSEIELIQRMGRTARKQDGTVYFLYTRNSVDEINMYIGMGKKKRMQSNILKETRTKVEKIGSKGNEILSQTPKKKKKQIELIENNQEQETNQNPIFNSAVIKVISNLIEFHKKIDLQQINLIKSTNSKEASQKILMPIKINKNSEGFRKSLYGTTIKIQIKELNKEYPFSNIFLPFDPAVNINNKVVIYLINYQNLKDLNIIARIGNEFSLKISQSINLIKNQFKSVIFFVEITHKNENRNNIKTTIREFEEKIKCSIVLFEDFQEVINIVNKIVKYQEDIFNGKIQIS